MIRTLLFSLFFLVGLFSAAAQSIVVQQDSVSLRAARAGLQISGETIICPGTITALKVEGEYARYEWDSGQLTPNLTVYKPGTYTVTVTTRGGCQLTGSVTVRYATGPCL
ncbi:MAG: hypothetical protein ABIO24_05905 [Saprospiraceae bacterium]